MITELPYSLTVNKKQYEIYCDFRDVINAICAYSDPELGNYEKSYILVHNLYVNDEDIPEEDFEEALKQACWFVDCGKAYKETENSPRLMDWEQDYNLIIPAVNKNANVIDVRELPFMHWWTFNGYLQERGECAFSSVVEVRDKMARGRNLEKYEREFLNANREQIILKDKYTEEQQKQIDELFGGE